MNKYYSKVAVIGADEIKQAYYEVDAESAPCAYDSLSQKLFGNDDGAGRVEMNGPFLVIQWTRPADGMKKPRKLIQVS